MIKSYVKKRKEREKDFLNKKKKNK